MINLLKFIFRYSMIDQECLENKINEWRLADPSVKIYFDPKTDQDCTNGEKKNFMFVYQSQWQQELLKRYGNEILLLDATYKTTRYALPLFFLTVKTNIDYQIVGTFVIENETREAITAALSVFKSWNPSLCPINCMTDYCNEEINSLEDVFPGNITINIIFWN